MSVEDVRRVVCRCEGQVSGKATPSAQFKRRYVVGLGLRGSEVPYAASAELPSQHLHELDTAEAQDLAQSNVGIHLDRFFSDVAVSTPALCAIRVVAIPSAAGSAFARSTSR